jgi:NAD(P)-dependent dehydrogenase (short-subunit alcohol dehydrogenase family)
VSIRQREIIVAGGSGGIGAEVTRTLAGDGAKLTITYRSNVERARELNSIARVEQADLTIAADRQRLLETTPELYGLVVMTGDPARASAAESAEDTMRRSHDNNYLGPILLAREAAELMTARTQPGAIVLISTMQAAALFPNSTMYASQKAALVHAARILAKETRGPSGVRVNVISPGIINAGMAQSSIASGKYNRFLDDGVISRFGKPKDIARAVRFLLEPDHYITGQVLCIDGGITL